MSPQAGRRRGVEWRTEHGPGYDLRQYQHGRPTGLVAILGWAHNEPVGLRHATGPDVRLSRDRSGIRVDEYGRASSGARLHLPMRSCLDAQLDEEPGLPGAALLRFSLTARIGPRGVFTLPLWFSAESTPFVRRLVEDIRQRRPEPRREPELPPARPSFDADWVIFRAADD